MHGGRKRYKKPPTQTKHPSAELDASNGEEQLKRAEDAMNNTVAREGQFRSTTPNSTASASKESSLPECPVKAPDGAEVGATRKETKSICKGDIGANVVETETKKLEVMQVEAVTVIK
jgi:hypothetical protein